MKFDIKTNNNVSTNNTNNKLKFKCKVYLVDNKWVAISEKTNKSYTIAKESCNVCSRKIYYVKDYTSGTFMWSKVINKSSPLYNNIPYYHRFKPRCKVEGYLNNDNNFIVTKVYKNVRNRVNKDESNNVLS